MTRTKFLENTATLGGGGGMWIGLKVNVSIEHSIFYMNSAKSVGGAVNVEVSQSCPTALHVKYVIPKEVKNV